MELTINELGDNHVFGVDLANGDDKTVVEQSSDFDIEKARRLFGLQDSLKAITQMRDGLINNKVSVLGNEEVSKKIDERVADYSLEQLKTLSDEEVKNIYRFDDGEVDFSIDFKDDESKKIEFMRNFLVFVKETSIAMAEIDKETERIVESLKADEEEFKKLVSKFGSLSSYIEADLRDRYERAETEEQKEKVGKMIQAYEHALTLENIIEHYKKFPTDTTISDLYHRPVDVYNRYMKVLKKLKVTTDLTQFDMLETKFLEEKYHVHPNLLLFAVIKYIAYKKNDADRSVDGVFLSQLAVNVRALFTNNFDSEEKKERFLQSVRNVLDLFI